MLRRAFPLAAAVALAIGNLAQAQPRFVRASPWIVPSMPRGRAIAVGGVSWISGAGWGNPYVVIEPRTTIQVFVAEPQPQLFTPTIDLSGIDLDVAPPPWAHEFERAPLPGPRLKLKPQPQEEAAKRVEPIKELPAKGKPIDPAAAARGKPPMAAEPSWAPDQEGLRLTLVGLTAFREQEYGLAARKFSQAIDADPTGSRAYFFLGQANFALGKYSDAVQAIGLGLAIDPAWPKMPFRPRFDLYTDHPEDWQRHAKLLEDAQARQPNHVGYLFLLAHQHWFDDQRDVAVKLFRQLRPLVADPALVDLFLKAKGS